MDKHATKAMIERRKDRERKGLKKNAAQEWHKPGFDMTVAELKERIAGLEKKVGDLSGKANKKKRIRIFKKLGELNSDLKAKTGDESSLGKHDRDDKAPISTDSEHKKTKKKKTAAS